MRTKQMVVFCVCCLLVFTLALAATARGQDKPLPFTISEDTTYITEPRTADGLVDYVTALEKPASEGVTPENNAAVCFYQAIGPRPGRDPLPDSFFRRLGMPRPDEAGPYLMSYSDYLRQELGVEYGDASFDRYKQDLEQATMHSWKAEDYPHVAGWLKGIEKPLNLVVQGSKRERYFVPMLITERDKESVLADMTLSRYAGILLYREAVKGLAARAMLRAGEGQYDQAWNELMTLLRFGNLIGGGPTTYEVMIGLTSIRTSYEATVSLVDAAEPNSGLARRWLIDIQQNFRLPDVTRQVATAERLTYLDTVQQLATGNVLLQDLTWSGEAYVLVLDHLLRPAIDWDLVMLTGNDLCDRVQIAMTTEDAQERYAMLMKIEQDMNMLTNEMSSWKFLRDLMLSEEPRRVLAEAVCSHLVLLLEATINIAPHTEDSALQQKYNLEIVLALEAFRADEGRYPERLNALVPRYLPEIPLDVFSGEELHYRPTESGYRLYSVGTNRKDDRGRSWHPGGDAGDLVVQVGAAK